MCHCISEVTIYTISPCEWIDQGYGLGAGPKEYCDAEVLDEVENTKRVREREGLTVAVVDISEKPVTFFLVQTCSRTSRTGFSLYYGMQILES